MNYSVLLSKKMSKKVNAVKIYINQLWIVRIVSLNDPSFENDLRLLSLNSFADTPSLKNVPSTYVIRDSTLRQQSLLLGHKKRASAAVLAIFLGCAQRFSSADRSRRFSSISSQIGCEFSRPLWYKVDYVYSSSIRST